MSTQLVVVGVDPGPTPGVCRLTYNADQVFAAEVYQTNHGSCFDLVDWLLPYHQDPDYRRPTVILAIERFHVGPGSARVATPVASRITRDLVGRLSALIEGRDVRLVQRSAAEVKPWGSDLRLTKSGLLDLTRGMPHARDACRHALFAAVSSGMPDPLSAKFTRVTL
jgi:hypothetical protein